jgi:hypothetical protein
VKTRANYDLINTKPLWVWNWHVSLDDAVREELLSWKENIDELHALVATFAD